MNNKVIKLTASIISLVMSLLPFLVMATDPNNQVYTINSPLASSDIDVLLGQLMKIVVQVGGVLVVLFIIYSGFKFVTARDSEPERKKAREIFYATIIGGGILLGADIIANIIIETVNITAGVKSK